MYSLGFLWLSAKFYTFHVRYVHVSFMLYERSTLVYVRVGIIETMSHATITLISAYSVNPPISLPDYIEYCLQIR